MRVHKRQPQIVLENGKPSAVILDFDDHEELLERAGDAADLEAIRAMRKNPRRFRALDEAFGEWQRI